MEGWCCEFDSQWRQLYFCWFWDPSMSILYKNARNVKFVLFRKNSKNSQRQSYNSFCSMFQLAIFTVITTHVRSARESNIYTCECMSVHHRWGGGTPSQVWMGGVPHPRSGRGVPHPRSGQGGTPSQVWTRGGYPGYLLRDGRMPLAFTQEDFLISFVFQILFILSLKAFWFYRKAKYV